jgi:mono/diheme cytochrome c family protein
MTRVPKKGKLLRWILLFCAMGLIIVAVCLAVFGHRPWVVPTAEKAQKNPLSGSEANLTAARDLYSNKCSDCHGAKGKGDGDEAMMYDPPPSDLTDKAEINKLTDGEIFYQISEGRKPMPSYKKKLTEEQRWQLVLLVRSFAAGQEAAQANAKPAPPSGKAN